jgi:hypothetical protein
MAGMMVITCPGCNKQFKGPTALEGRKVRCKVCGQVFEVSKAAAVEDEESPVLAVAVEEEEPKPAKPAKPVKPAKPKGKPVPPGKGGDHHEEEGSTPYAVTHLDLSPRCPHCAADMEEGAILCLHCGYNTQTRQHFETRRTLEHTGAEKVLWILPAVVCIILVLCLLGFIIFVWVQFPGLEKENKEAWWVVIVYGLFARIYSTVFSLAIMWTAGKFAFKRLVLHPTPPEKIVMK